jgi:glutaredoxin
MVHKSGQMGVPVIVIDDHVIIVFDQKRIDELTAKKA